MDLRPREPPEEYQEQCRRKQIDSLRGTLVHGHFLKQKEEERGRKRRRVIEMARMWELKRGWSLYRAGSGPKVQRRRRNLDK